MNGRWGVQGRMGGDEGRYLCQAVARRVALASGMSAGMVD